MGVCEWYSRDAGTCMRLLQPAKVRSSNCDLQVSPVLALWCGLVTRSGAHCGVG